MKKLKDLMQGIPPEALEEEVGSPVIVVLFLAPSGQLCVATNGPDDMVDDMVQTMATGKKYGERLLRNN